MEIDSIDEPKVDNQRKRLKKMLLDEDETEDIEKPSASSSMSESVTGIPLSSITEDEDTFSSELEFNDFGQYARWLTCKVRICWKVVICVRTWKMCVHKQELLSQFKGGIFLQV